MLETALDKEGLIYYDKKSKGYIDEKVLAEETRAKEVENDLELKKAPLESPTLTGTPTAPTASTDTNTTQIATTAFVQTAVSNLVDSAPETLNTLNELSSALGDDPNFATTIATQLGNKVDKVGGKGLSTNDYTTTEKTKLESIDTGAEVNQNAFSNVIVNDTTLSANSKIDNLTLEGDNISIIPDEENNKVTIGLTKDNITNVLGYEPGACEDIQEIEVVLSADNWIGTEAPYTQTVTVENLSLYNNCSIAISSGASSEQVNAIILADIGDISYEEDNKLTFIANGEKPSMDISIIVCAAQSMNVVEVPYIEVENTEDIKADISLLKETKSPVLHSSTDLSYGGGTSSKYGHVKLSDNYISSAGAADSSVGASSKAIFDAFSDIVSRLGSISETNSNYLKIGNYVIQWGFYVNMSIFNARVLTGVVDLPVPFLDTNYVSLGNAIFSITVTNKLINHIDNTVSIAQVSNTKLELRVYNPNNSFSAENIANYPISVRWLAIGRWR